MATETEPARCGLPPSARATHATAAGPGYLPSAIPHDLLAGVSAAHRRLLDLAAALDDATLTRPSLLPGWTVGQVLIHLAAQADVAAGAFTGAPSDRSDAASDARDAARADDSSRPAARADDPARGPARDEPSGRGPRMGTVTGQRAQEVRAALAAGIARLEHAWDATPVDRWRTGFGPFPQGPHRGTDREHPVALADLVFLRWREAEVHGVDLGLVDRGGPGWADLTAAYVDAEWAWTTARLPARLPLGVSVLLAPGDRPSRAFGIGAEPVVLHSPTVETLRWLLGRLPGAATPRHWPPLVPWE